MKLLIALAAILSSLASAQTPTKFLWQNFSSTAPIRSSYIGQFMQMPPEVQIIIIAPSVQIGTIYRATVAWKDADGVTQQKVQYCPAATDSGGDTLCVVFLDQPIVTVAVDVLKTVEAASPLN